MHPKRDPHNKAFRAESNRVLLSASGSLFSRGVMVPQYQGTGAHEVDSDSSSDDSDSSADEGFAEAFDASSFLGTPVCVVLVVAWKFVS